MMRVYSFLKRSKGIGIILIIFIGISLYIRLLDAQREEKLTKVAMPILQLCQTNHQCPDEKAVELNRDKFLLSHELMDYNTDNQQNNFTISWRVATGVSFIATGGINEPLTLQKEMD